jgi:hypothetical protein
MHPDMLDVCAAAEAAAGCAAGAWAHAIANPKNSTTDNAVKRLILDLICFNLTRPGFTIEAGHPAWGDSFGRRVEHLLLILGMHEA